MEKKKNPRGGRRDGAGRRPVLTEMERIAVGARCERLWLEEREVGENAAIASATRNLRAEHREAANVPVSERAAWIKANRLDHEENVEEALQLDRVILQRVIGKRPKGKRKAIIAQVASERNISKRLVKTCWKESRRIRKDLDEGTE